MKQYLKIILLLSVFSVFFSISAVAHTPLSENQTNNSLAPMLKNVMPAIVNISVESMKMTNLSDLVPNVSSDNATKVPVKRYAVGSGVIFDAAKGLIVTNAHVVHRAKIIVVTLKDGRRYLAKMLAKSDGYDIAILEIHATHLIALPFADSDNLKVGDFVTAIGSPYGLSQTVTSGIVSALNRSHPQIEQYQNFIQTDTPINPGNSGGALVNMQGQLIGMNTAMVAPSDGNIGIGFSIPSDMVKSTIQQLLQYGKVEHGALGVLVQNISPTLQNAMNLNTDRGALVTEVLPNTPAATADLKPKDIITKVNQHPIVSSDQLRNTMGLIRPTTPITLTIMRDKQIIQIKAIVGNPKTIKEKTMPYFSGVRMQELNELEQNGARLKGLLITKMSENTEAALAGLQPGDVITAINATKVNTISDLEKIANHNNKPLLLTVNRDNGDLYLVIRSE